MAVVIVELTPFLSALHALSRVLRIKWFQWLVFGAKVADGLAVAHPTVGPCPHARHQGIQQVRALSCEGGALSNGLAKKSRVGAPSISEAFLTRPPREGSAARVSFFLVRASNVPSPTASLSLSINENSAPPWEAERGRS